MKKKKVGSIFFKLVLLFFIVGMVLEFFNDNPISFFKIIPDAVMEVF